MSRILSRILSFQIFTFCFSSELEPIIARTSISNSASTIPNESSSNLYVDTLMKRLKETRPYLNTKKQDRGSNFLKETHASIGDNQILNVALPNGHQDLINNQASGQSLNQAVGSVIAGAMEETNDFGEKDDEEEQIVEKNSLEQLLIPDDLMSDEMIGQDIETDEEDEEIETTTEKPYEWWEHTTWPGDVPEDHVVGLLDYEDEEEQEFEAVEENNDSKPSENEKTPQVEEDNDDGEYVWWKHTTYPDLIPTISTSSDPIKDEAVRTKDSPDPSDYDDDYAYYAPSEFEKLDADENSEILPKRNSQKARSKSHKNSKSSKFRQEANYDYEGYEDDFEEHPIQRNHKKARKYQEVDKDEEYDDDNNDDYEEDDGYNFQVPKKSLSKLQNSEEVADNDESRFVKIYNQKIKEQEDELMAQRRANQMASKPKMNYPLPKQRQNEMTPQIHRHQPTDLEKMGMNNNIIDAVNKASSKVDDLAPIGGIGAGYASLDNTEHQMLIDQQNQMANNQNFYETGPITNIDDFHNEGERERYLNDQLSFDNNQFQNQLSGIGSFSDNWDSNGLSSISSSDSWMSAAHQEQQQYGQLDMMQQLGYLGSYGSLNSRIENQNPYGTLDMSQLNSQNSQLFSDYVSTSNSYSSSHYMFVLLFSLAFLTYFSNHLKNNMTENCNNKSILVNISVSVLEFLARVNQKIHKILGLEKSTEQDLEGQKILVNVDEDHNKVGQNLTPPSNLLREMSISERASEHSLRMSVVSSDNEGLETVEESAV